MLAEAILTTCDTDKHTLSRCLIKASIIVFKDGMFLVADETTIFYFGIPKALRGSRQFYKFYKDNEYLMTGKLFYSKNETPYKSHCIELSTNINYKNRRLFRWL